jgi:hypothetical protein
MDDSDDLTDSTAGGTNLPESQHPDIEREGSDVLPRALSAAVDSIDDLEHAPLVEHIERFQQIHSGLQDALSSIEGV